MTPDLWLPLVAAVRVDRRCSPASALSAVLARTAPERRRLREMALAPGRSDRSVDQWSGGLTEQLDPRLERIARTLPKSPKEMGRLRRRLAAAGITASARRSSTRVAELMLPCCSRAAAFTLHERAARGLDGASRWLARLHDSRAGPSAI